MTLAFVFPGQGSQAVGMGRDLAEAFPVARHLFEEVDEALDQKLSKIMFEGPEETLILTENAQPALMAVSMAVMRVLAEDGNVTVANKAAFVAGHSLGEYSALAAASAISLGDTARLLKLRGQSMQKAVPAKSGSYLEPLYLHHGDLLRFGGGKRQADKCVMWATTMRQGRSSSVAIRRRSNARSRSRRIKAFAVVSCCP